MLLESFGQVVVMVQNSIPDVVLNKTNKRLLNNFNISDRPLVLYHSHRLATNNPELDHWGLAKAIKEGLESTKPDLAKHFEQMSPELLDYLIYLIEYQKLSPQQKAEYKQNQKQKVLDEKWTEEAPTKKQLNFLKYLQIKGMPGNKLEASKMIRNALIRREEECEHN